MDNLPKDPNILLSVLNTKLRDQYDSLDALCEDLDVNKEELVNKMAGASYTYDEATNQFK